MLLLEGLYGYWYSDYNKELETIKKQRDLRHLLHKQINLSNVKLKKVNTIEKIGIWELEKHSKVPVPKFDEVVLIDKKTSKRTFKKKKS
jgi:hypothetical protein